MAVLPDAGGGRPAAHAGIEPCGPPRVKSPAAGADESDTAHDFAFAPTGAPGLFGPFLQFRRRLQGRRAPATIARFAEIAAAHDEGCGSDAGCRHRQASTAGRAE
ncbi:MAG: hypothetical protein ABJG94_03700, partial [Nitratireductor sp.]